jgi:acyl-CoA synthetase (AMP-forming)/AMP-acid ligase II/acyl carrier protein
MPLFHLHGLSAVLSSWIVGAQVFCPRVFDPLELPRWVLAMDPTWLTASPTIHQSVLAVAERHPEMVARRSLRFLRSTSASMPPQMIADVERVFGVPLIEAYAMTEAASPIASNPLPPGKRKPGSVGRPAGPEVAILDADGALVPVGQSGEVAIRGPNVMRGYEGSSDANRAAFADGWLRTGDQGRFDEEGYLYITGRLKELINRGGEKIAPREVDEALLAHPAVAEAASFAVPHPRLGEDVAAAVVLRSGASVTARELSSFVGSRLSDFKVPRRIVFVDTIPRGPTTKVQRVGLAEKLGLCGREAAAASPPDVAPRGALEETIARIWREVLGVARVGALDDFFELGGHSLHATAVLTRVRAELGVDLGLSELFAGPTVEALAKAVAAERRLRVEAEMETVLTALEGMSEEDAERLLAERGG